MSSSTCATLCFALCFCRDLNLELIQSFLVIFVHEILSFSCLKRIVIAIVSFYFVPAVVANTGTISLLLFFTEIVYRTMMMIMFDSSHNVIVVITFVQ
mmetsp:Transcript_1430/g.1503  ORF Transcript_1430/g.1503 Transcript_1430/m.1503 type:complete len:98 (-) Transcript_1430:449-742(-)